MPPFDYSENLLSIRIYILTPPKNSIDLKNRGKRIAMKIAMATIRGKRTLTTALPVVIPCPSLIPRMKLPGLKARVSSGLPGFAGLLRFAPGTIHPQA